MKRTILIIEDNESNMYMMTYLLETSNYKVIQSSDGIEGVLKAVEVNPDGILLDIQLPGKDGYDIIRELKTIHHLRQVPVIVVTSYAMPGDMEKSYEAGASGYIEKPIDPDKFILQMESFL